MSAETVLLRGIVREDGTLEIPGKVTVTPGPVEITVRPVAATARPVGDWLAALDKTQAEQATRGSVPRSAEEIDAEINASSDEREEHQLAIERIFQGDQRAVSPEIERE